MAAPAERLEPVRFAARPGGPSAESRAWRKYRNNVIIKEFGAVSNVGFSPLAPYDLATSSSARIQIYSSITRGMQRSITRFKDVATCFDIRRDGKLLVAGDSTGLVQVWGENGGAVLTADIRLEQSLDPAHHARAPAPGAGGPLLGH